jgi:pyrroloquinoline quinone (PQQ) biosynthesis protein C
MKTLNSSLPVLETFQQVTQNHPLWNHQFLNRCRTQSLNLNEVKILAVQMYKFCKEFCNILSTILAHCSNLDAQMVIMENLMDETGLGNPNMAHPELYRRFTRALGIDDKTLDSTPANLETQKLINTYLKLANEYGYLAAVGAVCFASEGIVNTLYTQLRAGIQSAGSFSEDDLLFFHLHIDIDGDHAKSMAVLLEEQITSSEQATDINRAILEAMDARVEFFDGIERQIANASVAQVNQAAVKSDQQITNSQALAFSQEGDRLFNELAERIANQPKQYRLLFEHRLKPEFFQDIKIAAANYISVCLGSPIILSEAEMLEKLLAERGNLANYTGTGLLAPKREYILEFNLFQKSVAKAFYQLGANDLIDAVDLPVNLRMVYGKGNPESAKLPFTSSKVHSDVWAGVPADAVVVVLPLFGDIDDITIEAGEMSPEMELPSMRVLSSFDEGRDIRMAVKYQDAKLELGTMYFNDARGLHQTVRRKSSGLRISLDFRFRRKFNDSFRAMINSNQVGVEEDMSIPYAEWLKFGSEKLVVFHETLAEAKINQNNAFYLKGYRVVDIF